MLCQKALSHTIKKLGNLAVTPIALQRFHSLRPLTMTRTSARTRQPVNYNEEDDKPARPAKVNSKVKETKKESPATARTGKRKVESEAASPEVSETETPAPKKRKSKAKDEPEISEPTKPAAPAKARKAKAKVEDSTPLAARTAVSSLGKAMYIGAHVSAAGGVQNSITNAIQIGANSFALFLKSQRKWDNPPLSDEAKDLFIGGCKDHDYSAAEHALPHGSYLVNLAQAEPTKATQAYTSFVDDLIRCEKLGIKLYNFHPGNTGGDARDAAIARIASQLNKAHKATSSVVTVLENMAGQGNVIGSTWEDLRDIIALVDDKDRVGVCIDTCHAFAAGYDLRSPEAFRATMDSFNDIVGPEYLKAFHLNDSKAPIDSNRDLHANIGTGFLGLRAFHNVMNEDAFRGKPMVLETPIDKKGADGKTIEDKQVWADEIKLLESLIGMDAESDEFVKLEKELFAKGADERSKIQAQVDKKNSKPAKKKK